VRTIRLAVIAFSCIALAACSAGSTAPDFTLHDERGNRWTLSQQRDTAVLLTFGFTHCADTCPATLGRLSGVARSLGGRGRAVEIAFVTVDPARDQAVVLRKFLARCDTGAGRLVGLTGTPGQIAAVENAYHVWAQRAPGHSQGATDYEEAHSSVIFLIDRRSRIHTLRDPNDSQTSLEHAVAELVS
jgi:protein SCO1/2